MPDYFYLKSKSFRLNTVFFSRDPIIFWSPDHLNQETNSFLGFAVVLQLFWFIVKNRFPLKKSKCSTDLPPEVSTLSVSITGVSALLPGLHLLDLLINPQLLWDFLLHTGWSSPCCWRGVSWRFRGWRGSWRGWSSCVIRATTEDEIYPSFALI